MLLEIRQWQKFRQELSSCWDGRPFGHSRRGPKSGELLCPFPWGAWSPSNTMPLGPRPSTIPSGMPNSCSIQPFGHHTPTLQTDNGHIALNEPFHKRSPKTNKATRYAYRCANLATISPQSGLNAIVCLYMYAVFQIWNTAKKAGKKVATLMLVGSDVNIQGV